ncbi:MAG: hypothetical protein GX897_04855 [Clostridiales bacterium]|nr:hypothetical protein [Clostridiales bacterium]
MKNKIPEEKRQYKVINASDIYIWEEDGKTYADYHVGDQQGYPPVRGPILYIRREEFNGPMSGFLEKLFN